MTDYEHMLFDLQKENIKESKFKDKIIIVLVILLFLEAVIGYSGFVWYEAQFEYGETETVTTTETTNTELNADGDNAHAEYNNVEGNQYNDNAVHNDEGGVD